MKQKIKVEKSIEVGGGGAGGGGMRNVRKYDVNGRI